MSDQSIPYPSRVLMDAETLRSLADTAEGIRDIPIYLGIDENGELAISIDNPPHRVLVEVMTHSVAPDRPRASSVTLEVPGESVTTVYQLGGGRYDALFWSESAVEKFLLPYYASKSMWEAAEKLESLSWAWYGKVPTSAPTAPGAYLGELPVAVAHTPDSDWQLVGGREEFDAIVRGPDGLRAVPLSELAALHRSGTADAAADRAPRTPAARDGR